ncbi:hypothetical protein IVB45_02155 [Bradyrhizobium sp. 4]|uniref:hypothetical protein n=1 Tax=Bradyrhizobium sp. 4 TaxID=2782678 RepID=UPI001FFFD83B|nr:hypothetical protein [Bradyrhizobium sp. 4]UPJ35837.1 hypothetical protein IVB45_02155 [Bradyrhizobium sp. 4]
MTKLDQVRAAIIKAVPEIVELKFGCQVLVDGEVMIATYWNTSNDSLDVYAPEQQELLHHTFNLYPKEYEILGRPIRLADCLVAIDQRCRGDNFATVASNGWFHYGGTRAFWNLRTDDLSQQSPECISFLHDLLTR